MDRLREFDSLQEDGVFYIGHSSALIRMSQQLIFCDPVWAKYRPYGDNWTFKPGQINCNEVLDRARAAFVSHIHADHYSPQVIGELLDTSHIFIKDGRPDLKKKLNSYANRYNIHQFNKVIQKPAFEWFQAVFGYDIDAIFFPHPFNSVDSAYAIRNNKTGYTVWFGNDCFLDEGLCQKVKETIGHIDVAMLPYSFIHFYPYLQSNISEEEKLKEIARLRQQSLDQAKMFMDIVKPKITIPIGNSLFYIDGSENILNAELARPHDVVGAIPLIAGDYVLASGYYTSPVSRERYEEILSEPPSVELIRHRVENSFLKVDGHIIVVNGLVIDTEKLTVKWDTEWDAIAMSERDRHVFKVEIREFNNWLCGEMTFEEVLGSRRFVFSRDPNTYNQKVLEFMQRVL